MQITRQIAGASTALLVLAILAGLAYPLFLVTQARAANDQVNSFPLDDAWIHLTFARNLQEYGSFSYFPGEGTRAGSTAPLFTMLLALGFAFSDNGPLLGYLLGLLFHALFLFSMAAWARVRLGDPVWAAAAVLIVGLDPRVGMLAVSGMETSAFLALVALAFFGRASERWLLCGIAIGLAVWMRPDGFILLLALALDLLFWRIATGSPAASKRDLLRAGASAAVLVAAYFTFNLAIGGRLLPNTFSAKTAAYGDNPRALFLREDMAGTFFQNGWTLLAPFAAGFILFHSYRLIRRQPEKLQAEIGWLLGLSLAYLLFLPYSHFYNRYLVPALPALLLLSLVAIRRIGARHRIAGIVAALLLVGSVGLQAKTLGATADRYSEACRYYWIRHQRTGDWLSRNTAPDAIVATHDIGAIAYYSRRKIVDIAGLVQPDVIEHIGQPDYLPYLEALFEREGVTHLALLKNWLEVSNVESLFLAEPEYEFLEVYAWQAHTTHLMPREATQINQHAREAIQERRDVDGALKLLRLSLQIDNASATTWMLLGATHELGGRHGPAIEAYRRAVELFPDYEVASSRLERLQRLTD